MKTNTHDQKVAEAEGNAIYQQEESQQTATTTQTKLPVIIPHSPKNRSQPNLLARLSQFIGLLTTQTKPPIIIPHSPKNRSQPNLLARLSQFMGLLDSIFNWGFYIFLFMLACVFAFFTGVALHGGICIAFFVMIFGFCFVGYFYVKRMAIMYCFRILDHYFRKWLKINDE